MESGSVTRRLTSTGAIGSLPCVGKRTSDRVLVFTLAEHDFALPADRVRECLPLPLLWRRPGMPVHVAGFFSLGGMVVPVLDLARLLGLRDRHSALSLEADGLYRHLIRIDRMALLVDRVTAVATAMPAPVDPVADDWQQGCIAGRVLVANRLASLFDVDRLLLQDEAARLRLLAEAAERREQGWDASGGDDAG